jgi:hypothetical protein
MASKINETSKINRCSYKTNGGWFIGILSLIVIIYRVIYIGGPIFTQGYETGDIGLMLKSLTQLV